MRSPESMGLQARSHSHLVLLTLCFAFVFATSMRIAKSEPASLDDAYAVKHLYYSRDHPLLSVNNTIDSVAAIGTKDHTPLYFVLLNLWSRYTGRDLLTLRLFSLLFGLLALAFTYQLTRLAGGKTAAQDAVLITSFLAFFVFYTQVTRIYSLLLFLSAWVMWSYWKTLSTAESPSPLTWLSLIVSAIAIIYTHLSGFFLLAAIGLYHLVFAPKDRRWLIVCLAMFVAGLLFLPWLPTTLEGLTVWSGVPASDGLPLIDALLAVLSIYSNGLLPLIPCVGLLIAFRYKRLRESQRYIIVLACLLLAIMLIANEITPLLVARRMRYTLILAISLSCALAIGLNLLPKWRLFRLPALIIWIAAFILYRDSSDMLLYINWLTLRQDAIPHYQHLIYEPRIEPRNSDFVLSFHKDTRIGLKALDYYGRKAGTWRGLMHIYNDDVNNPVVQSTDARYMDLESMAIWHFPIWLIHDPQQTDLQTMHAFSTDFSARFQSCGRYLETDNTTIDLYVENVIPCELLLAQRPLAIQYDNGSALANILLQPTADELNVYTWWTRTLANEYAFSLQLFDSLGEKVAQLDDVVGGDALYAHSLNIAALPPDDYSAKLILYDFTSHESQPGVLLMDQQPFVREVDIPGISIHK